MEEIAENVAFIDNVQQMHHNDNINSGVFQSQTAQDEEVVAKFMCNLCMKTFYNANALQNHKNTQHDGEVAGSEEDSHAHKTNLQSFSNTNALNGFKFIPLKSRETDPISFHDGLASRTFSVDTTYLLVTVEGDIIQNDLMKHSRFDGDVKRTPNIVKPVDLRGPFTCTFPSTMRSDLQCRQIFFNCCEYSLHYREEHTKRRKAALRCQVCEKRLDRDFVQDDPMMSEVQPPRRLTFSCHLCARTFLDSAEYDEHNRSMHAKMKPYQCNLCAKRFTQHGGLQQHMRMHSGIRPFACTFCQKAFTQKAGLDQHLRTHTKVKPFKCVICSKCFSQSVHLRQHMRTHTNIQPFGCSICNRRFKQSSHLNFHMRSHADESLGMENYQGGQHDEIGFLNLPNLQPVKDGDTMYYAVDLAAGSALHQNPFTYV